MNLALNCKANKEGGKIKQLLLQKYLPLDDFQSQVGQPLLHHFGLGSLLHICV